MVKNSTTAEAALRETLAGMQSLRVAGHQQKYCTPVVLAHQIVAALGTKIQAVGQ